MIKYHFLSGKTLEHLPSINTFLETEDRLVSNGDEVYNNMTLVVSIQTAYIQLEVVNFIFYKMLGLPLIRKYCIFLGNSSLLFTGFIHTCNNDICVSFTTKGSLIYYLRIHRITIISNSSGDFY